MQPATMPSDFFLASIHHLLKAMNEKEEEAAAAPDEDERARLRQELWNLNKRLQLEFVMFSRTNPEGEESGEEDGRGG
jgi:hypothetical protein